MPTLYEADTDATDATDATEQKPEITRKRKERADKGKKRGPRGRKSSPMPAPPPTGATVEAKAHGDLGKNLVSITKEILHSMPTEELQVFCVTLNDLRLRTAREATERGNPWTSLSLLLLKDK